MAKTVYYWCCWNVSSEYTFQANLNFSLSFLRGGGDHVPLCPYLDLQVWLNGSIYPKIAKIMINHAWISHHYDVSILHVQFSIKLGFHIIVFAGVWMNSYGSTLHLQFSIKLGYRFCRSLMPFLAIRIWTKEATRKPRNQGSQGSHTEHLDLSVLSVAGGPQKVNKKQESES